MWKYTIMREIFLHSPEIAEEFREELERIAYEPNENEILEEIVEDAMEVLEHYAGKDKLFHQQTTIECHNAVKEN